MAKKETFHVGESFMLEDISKAMIAKLEESEGIKYTHKAMTEILNAFKGVVTEALAQGFKVQLTGFLALSPEYSPSRQANNLTTQTRIEVPEHATVKTKLGKSLYELRYSYTDNQLKAMRTQWEAKKAPKETPPKAPKAKK